MDRISLYTDIDNLAEIFSMKRGTPEFLGVKQFISKESKLIICEPEEVALQNELFLAIAIELTSGDFLFEYRDENEAFLNPPFKTNLHVHFKDKRSILFSYDNERVKLAKTKTGLLLGGIGEEIEVYNKLNFNKEFFRGDKILTIGNSFKSYTDLKPFILPFCEIIINEPYLFRPDRNDWDIHDYIDNNFKPLMKVLLSNIKSKINVVICTFVNEQNQNTFPYFDQNEENETNKGFSILYKLCCDYLSELLGADRYKLWLIVSPMARKARHDRYILTNYQYIESPAGLTYFDDRGNFISRGEAIHNYSIMHDDARKELIPMVIKNLQEKVIDSVIATHPNRIYGIENGDSYFFKFS